MSSRSPKKGAPKRSGPRKPGPHGRLGVVWAVVTAAVLLAGPLPLAVWLAAHAGLAGAQAARSHAGRAKRPPVHPLAAAAGAGLVPLACAFGFTAAAVGLVLAAATAVGLPIALGDPQTHPARAVAIAAAVGAAAGSLVLARTDGSVPALFLFGLTSAYDTGAYLVGTGASNAWEGPAAGVAAIGPVTLAAAAGAVPPFQEVGPWVLGGLAAALAPLGPSVAGRLLLGPRRDKARVPALKRLDVLVVLGPVWAVAAHLLLRP
jgi:hypothetical protein